MKKNWLIIAVVVLTLLLSGLIIKNKFFAKPGTGALQISCTPKATVYIDGEQKGSTLFYSDKIIAGEHTVKLVPESTIDNLISWEGKINVSPAILTAINRVLGKTETESSGNILTLEKISSRDTASLAVVSIPDKAMVKIDGEPQGFTPILKEKLKPSDYQVIVSSTGYEEKTITAQTVAGYKLTVSIKLAQKIEGITEATPSGELAETETSPSPSPKASPSPSPNVSPKPSATPPDKPYVKIKETSTGWLNVRSEPSNVKGDETVLTKVYPGEMYPYLNEEKNGWYKIEYEEGKEGWASGVYCELIK